MKRILLRIANGLLAEGIFRELKESGDFMPYQTVAEKNDAVLMDVCSFKPQLVLLEACYSPEYQATILGELSDQIHKKLSDCRVAIICDEKSAPDIARDVVSLKQTGRIDGFFYTSVTGSYLKDALKAM